MSNKKFSIKLPKILPRNSQVLPMILGKKSQVFKNKRRDKNDLKNLDEYTEELLDEDDSDKNLPE